MRRLRIVAVILVGALAVVAGVWYYLTHHYNAAPHLTAKVEQVFGGRVELANANVGLGQSTAEGLKLYESKEHAHKPWLQAEQIKADASIFDLLKGLLPHKLTLRGVTLHLRFDKEGHLLTDLPSPQAGEAGVPEVLVENATLVIDQEGRPGFTIRGAELTMRQDGGQYTVTGNVQDPEWGSWSLTARAAGDLESAQATAKNSRVRFTQAMLTGLPFVAPDVWKQVHCDGDTSAEIGLKVNREEDSVHLHIELEPTFERVHVPAVDVRATAVKGKITLKDDVLKVTDLDGRLADGQARLNAELNFSQVPARFQLGVKVSDVQVQKLPQTWAFPAEIAGKLTGHAELTVNVKTPGVQTSGKGEGVIKDAMRGGAPVAPIRVSLEPVGGGYRFKLD